MTKVTYTAYRVIKNGFIEVGTRSMKVEEGDTVLLAPGVGVKYINLGTVVPELRRAVKIIKIPGTETQDSKSYKVG